MEPQKTLPLGLTFDDVLLLPGYSNFSRGQIDLSTKLSRNIKLSIPLVSAPMDTVTESKLAIALARLGGIGIIHRNLSIENQAKEVAKVKKEKLLVGAAVGSGKSYQERVKVLVKAGADVIVVDSAHGHAKSIIDATSWIKKTYKNIDVVSGNIATSDGARALIKAGADGLRVGMGPGAICTTRIISGMGVPQITALTEVLKAARKANIPVIADGGIKFSGDMVKALATGASSVMMGSFFASTVESPGKIVRLSRSFVPHRFLSILGNNRNVLTDAKKKSGSSREISIRSESLKKVEEMFEFKEYRGMGSRGAMEKGAKVRSEGEFHGKDYKDRTLIAEGVEGLVPVKGSVSDLVEQAIGGIKSGMYYVGAKSIAELWKKAKFIQITQASLTESHPHSVLITNPGENYTQ